MESFIAKLLLVIPAVMEMIKKFIPQMQGNVTIIVTLIVGAIAGGVYDAVTNNPIATSLALVYGFIAGGIAAGLWSIGSTWMKKIGNNK